MLSPDSPVNFRVESQMDQNPRVRLETKYLKVEVREEMSAANKMETWAAIETRPAFEIALLRREDGVINTLLMRKRRRVIDSPLTKFPGGYIWDEPEKFIPAHLKAAFGIEAPYTQMKAVGHVIGHSTIRTPIQLLYTFDWWQVEKPSGELEFFQVSLDDAVDMAVNYNLENDSSFTMAMRLCWLQKEGWLI